VESSRISKIGVLTGGGDCPGLNAVIRAVVKTAIRKYRWQVVGIENGFDGLVENRMRPLGFDDVKGILSRGGTVLGSSNRGNPFAYKKKVGDKVTTVDASDKLMQNLASQHIDALVIIGGDGSLSIANQLSKRGVCVVGVPKTIDNDLSATEVTFGFDTAINTAVDAIDKLRTTAESHHRVMVVELMGRYAGWIALEAGIAGGADVILIPEIEFDYEAVAALIEERVSMGRKSSIVVVAEGAKAAGEDYAVKMVVEESFEPIRLGGIGDRVASEITRLTGRETRVTVLGHIQRGGSPSAFDRILTTRLGVAAIDALAKGNYGCMVRLRSAETSVVPLEEAVGEIRTVPPDSELVRVAKAVGVSFGEKQPAGVAA